MIHGLTAENKKMKMELAEMTRLMAEQFDLKVAAMNAGKAMLREAMMTLEEDRQTSRDG